MKMALFEHERFACSKKATSTNSPHLSSMQLRISYGAMLRCFEELVFGFDFSRFRGSGRAADKRTRRQIKNHRSDYFRFNNRHF